MFGIGGSEIIVILVLALIFLGPDKLPDAAKQISKGIRDLKRHGRVLQRTIEDDEHIGGAIRDLKSALRGDEIPPSTKPPLKRRKKKRALVLDAAGNPVVVAGALATAAEPTIMPPAVSTLGSLGTLGSSNDTTRTVPAAAAVAAAEAAVVSVGASELAVPAPRPAITLPPTAGERDPDDKSPAAIDADDAAELAAMIRPAAGTVGRATGTEAAKSGPERG